MKALPTWYADIEFRSRLEARWAIFFDCLGLHWEYEREGFDLGDSGWYLPDFWLADVRMWAEIKPTEFSETEFYKAQHLADFTEFPCLLLDGTPADRPYKSTEPRSRHAEWWPEWPTSYNDYLDPSWAGWPNVYCLTTMHGYPFDEHRFYCSPGGWDDARYEDVEEAAAIALSVRFDSGELSYRLTPQDLVNRLDRRRPVPPTYASLRRR